MEEYPNIFAIGVTRYARSTVNIGETCVKFSPDLSLQRYCAVLSCLESIADQEDLRIITEFGPNRCGFLFRALESVSWLEKINLVDVDSAVLFAGADMLRNRMYNRTQHGRLRPLTAYLYRGNVAQTDHRVADAQVVVGIELIEHLTASDLDALPANVFGYMRPSHAIFTTPNSEFNVLFSFENGRKFRHPDHKFEFTRREFREWAQRIVERYPAYEFRIYGIGPPPEDVLLEDVGYASQIVIFSRKSDHPTVAAGSSHSPAPVESYEFIDEVPLNFGDSSTPERKYLLKIGTVGYRILWDLAFDRPVYMRQERCPLEHHMDVIPVKMVVKHLQYANIVTDVETVIKAFREYHSNWEVERTIAFGPVFVYKSDCWSNSHDEELDYDPNEMPSPTLYALPSVSPDGADAESQLDTLELDICRCAERFLDAIQSDLKVNGIREACELEHSMDFVTPEMVVAHLKSLGLETNTKTLLARWCELESPKYPLEETSFGWVFLLYQCCGEDFCQLDRVAHSSWDDDSQR